MKKIIPIAMLLCFGILKAQQLQPLDTTTKIENYFFALSSSIDTANVNPDYLKTISIPKTIQKKTPSFLKPAGMQLIVKPKMIKEFGHGTKGFQVFFVNGTAQTQHFSVQGGRIAIIRQVLYKVEWVDLEYFKPYHTRCGNDYYYNPIALAPNSYWEFTAPELTGDT